MTEQTIKANARARVLRACEGLVWYNHQDKFTGGIPDSSLTWDHADSWLEFKLLDPNQSVHDRLKKTQHVELMRLERQTGRAWVVAWRKANVRKLVTPKTEIYAPSALFGGRVPIVRERTTHERLLQDLRAYGVAQLEGFDHDALVALLRATHGATL